jgi:hypothetical protein
MEEDEFARSHEKEMRIGYCCDRNSESRKERLSVIDCRRFVFWDDHRTEITLWWVQMINGNYKPKRNPVTKPVFTNKTQQKSFKSTSLHRSFQMEIGNILSDFNWQFCRFANWKKRNIRRSVHAHSSSSMFATAAAELKYSCKMSKDSENTHNKKSNKRKNKTTFLSSVFHKKQKR